jgi:hypothetical protein
MDFTWRHATISEGVNYNTFFPVAGPFNSFNGLISGWGKAEDGMYPSSYPSQASAIFGGCIESNERKQYYEKNEKDEYNFYWIITEDEAKEFLSKNYNSIYKQTLEKLENNN